MSVASELARLRRDVQSLAEEIATSTGPRARAPLGTSERRTAKAEMQALIQQLDELATKVSG